TASYDGRVSSRTPSTSKTTSSTAERDDASLVNTPFTRFAPSAPLCAAPVRERQGGLRASDRSTRDAQSKRVVPTRTRRTSTGSAPASPHRGATPSTRRRAADLYGRGPT